MLFLSCILSACLGFLPYDLCSCHHTNHSVLLLSQSHTPNFEWPERRSVFALISKAASSCNAPSLFCLVYRLSYSAAPAPSGNHFELKTISIHARLIPDSSRPTLPIHSHLGTCSLRTSFGCPRSLRLRHLLVPNKMRGLRSLKRPSRESQMALYIHLRQARSVLQGQHRGNETACWARCLEIAAS